MPPSGCWIKSMNVSFEIESKNPDGNKSLRVNDHICCPKIPVRMNISVAII